MGSDNLYEFVVDADRRIISIKAPDYVKGENDFTPSHESEQFEYLKIGDFIYVGSDGFEKARICPQIKLMLPSKVGELSVTLDSRNGLVFKSKINYQGVKEEHVSGFTHNGLFFDLRNFPDDRRMVGIGEFYRDGEFIKIRTS